MGADLHYCPPKDYFMERTLSEICNRSDGELEQLRRVIEREQNRREHRFKWLQALKPGDEVLFIESFRVEYNTSRSRTEYYFKRGETDKIIAYDTEKEVIFVRRDGITLEIKLQYIGPLGEVQ